MGSVSQGTVQEGNGLGTGAGKLDAEDAAAHAIGDAILDGPHDGQCVVGIGIHVGI